jgi:hypothetical protein
MFVREFGATKLTVAITEGVDGLVGLVPAT